jgi:hypothetical protein
VGQQTELAEYFERGLGDVRATFLVSARVFTLDDSVEIPKDLFQ